MAISDFASDVLHRSEGAGTVGEQVAVFSRRSSGLWLCVVGRRISDVSSGNGTKSRRPVSASISLPTAAFLFGGPPLSIRTLVQH